MFNMAAKLSFINMTNHTCLNKIHHINQQSISKSSTIINFIRFEHKTPSPQQVQYGLHN